MLEMAAQEIAQNLKDAVVDRGSASFIVSGGSSPLPIFDALVDMNLPWDKIIISLVDDRLVADDDAASNVKLVHERLWVGKAAKATFISLKEMDTNASQIARPFDVMLLGMGTDGHFASLFPEMPDPKIAYGLDAKPQLIRTPPRGNPLLERVSMNLSMILDSRHLYLMVAGAEKQSVFDRARTDTSLPIHHLITQKQTTLHILKR